MSTSSEVSSALAKAYVLPLAALAVVAYVLYKYVLLPFIAARRYKRLYGERVICIVAPFMSLYYHFIKGSVVKGDAFYYFRRMVQENPNAEVVIGLGQTIELYSFLTPPLIKQVLVTQVQKFERAQSLMFIDHFLVKGLLFSQGETWRRQRKTLSASFRFDVFREKLPMVTEVTRYFLRQMDDEGGQNAAKPSGLPLRKNFPICRFFQQITGEVVFRVFFGSAYDDQNDNGKVNKDDAQGSFLRCPFDKSKLLSQELAEIATEIGHCLLQPRAIIAMSVLGIGWWNHPVLSLLMSSRQRACLARIVRFKAHLKAMIDARIREKKDLRAGRRARLSRTHGIIDDIIDELVLNKSDANENDANIDAETSEEILQQFMTFFFAGMDTTGVTSGMCLYYLAKYGDAYEKVYDEMKRIRGADSAHVPPLQFEQLREMDYTHAFIKETLRQFTVTGAFIPRVAQEDVNVGGYLIPKGSEIATWTQLLHTSPRFRDKSEEFRPERFLLGARDGTDTNSQKDAAGSTNSGTAAEPGCDPFSFIPFSAGPHNCIGQHLAQIEIKVILYETLLRFRPVLRADKNVQRAYVLIQMPSDEYIVELEPLVK